MNVETALLAGLFFLAAALYSSVGHAGASAYLASMALLGFAPEQMKPTALALNILVGGIGVIRFHRARLIPWRDVAPFVLTSVPCAYIAAQWHIPKQTYSLMLSIVLAVAALGAWRSAKYVETFGESVAVHRAPFFLALLIGAAIGCLSGITGTGGAIFLTPLLLFFAWAHTRQASGISIAFVWLNSLAGFIGLLHNEQALPAALPIWLIAVALGALLGTQLGIHHWPAHRLRKSLALVLAIAAVKLLLH